LRENGWNRLVTCSPEKDGRYLVRYFKDYGDEEVEYDLLYFKAGNDYGGWYDTTTHSIMENCIEAWRVVK
jgi:hypothetical protein